MLTKMHKFSSYLFWIGILLIFIFYRLPYIEEVFLSIDESVYSAIAVQILDGEVVYKDAWERHPAGIFYVYALIYKIFGIDMLAVHLITLLWLVFVSYLCYRAGWGIFDRKAGYLSAFIFSIIANTFYINEFHASNTEMWMTAFLVLALWTGWIGWIRDKDWMIILSGAFIGFSMHFKQVALFNLGGVAIFFIFGWLYNLRSLALKDALRKGMLAILGAAASFMVISIYFIVHGAFRMMVFLNYSVNFKYVGGVAWSTALSYFAQRAWELILPNIIFWLMGIGWLVLRSPCLLAKSKNYDIKARYIYLFLWFITCLAGVAVGKRFFGHYFYQLLPVLAILCGAFASQYLFTQNSFHTLGRMHKPIVVFFVIFGVCLATWRFPSRSTISKKEPSMSLVDAPQLYKMKFVEEKHSLLKSIKAPRIYYDYKNFLFGANLPKSKEQIIGEYIRKITTPDDTIFIWGFFSQVYYYAQRKPGTRFTFTDFMTPHTCGARDDPNTIIPTAMPLLIEDLNTNKPKVIVDSSTADYFGYGAYPMRLYPSLWDVIIKHYVRRNNISGFDIYVRREMSFLMHPQNLGSKLVL